MIKKIIAIILLPIIILITSDLTKVKEVIHEDFTIISKTDNTYSIDKDLYSILITYQENKNYSITSEYNIDNTDVDILNLCYIDLCNELINIDNQYRININVGLDENGNTYELAVKNPKTKVIEDGDISYSSTAGDVIYYIIQLPEDSINVNLTDKFSIEGYSKSTDALGDINDIGKFRSWNASLRRIGVGFPLATTLQQAKAELVDKTLTYELATPRLAEAYEIDSIKYTYDPNDKSFNFSINEGYNEFKLLPDNTIQAVTGPQLLDNTYSITYNVYQIDEPMVRNIVEIIPLIYIGVVVVYIFISRKD